MRAGSSAALVAVVCAIASAPAAAQDRAVTAGVSMRFVTGTFGSERETTLVYAPAMVKVDAGRFEVAGFFPYLTINDGTVAMSQAGFVPMRGTVTSAPSAGMSWSPSGGMTGGHMMGGRQPAAGSSAAIAATPLTSQSGIGDIYAVVGYRLVDDLLSGVQVAVSARVKAPTASYTRGLGTGRTDAGVVATIRKRWDAGWFTVDGGFMKIGDPVDVELRDVAVWSVGGGRRITDRLFAIASAAGNTSVLDGFDAPLEVAAGVGFRLRDGVSVTLLPSAGLTASSPRFALTAGVTATLWDSAR